MNIPGKFFEEFLESRRRIVFLVSLLIALTFACVAPAQAGGVVSTCDETHLRSALAGGGTVTFACSGTITLTAANGGTITITSPTTIDGTGQNVTINGGGHVGVFSVPSGATLNLKKMTIANGASQWGGGIDSTGGVVTVNNCTFTGNTATGTTGRGGGTGFGAAGGAISNGQDVLGNPGTLTVTSTIFSGNSTSNNLYSAAGGAIFSAGKLTVTNSTFSGNFATCNFFPNSACSGGGIFAAGGTVLNSTFSGNAASYGGGILTEGSVAVINSSISGNSASYGGGIYSDGTLTVTNSTVSGNSGGGIYNVDGEIAVLRNTVVANTSGGGNCYNHYPSFDGGGNLSWPDTTCPGINQDPKLAAAGLQNNGGPTQTIPLLAGSPAIYAAVDANCPTADQRGVIRPQGAHCDIGAYEYDTANSLKTTVLDHMNAFLLTLNPHDAAALEDVIKPLANSLDPNLWLGADGNHLNASVGERVFEQEEKTVGQLSQLIVDQTQLLYLSNLALADRTLATVAIADATGGDLNKLAKATTELTSGDASALATEYGKAIEHYENAWTLALQAKP